MQSDNEELKNLVVLLGLGLYGLLGATLGVILVALLGKELAPFVAVYLFGLTPWIVSRVKHRSVAND